MINNLFIFILGLMIGSFLNVCIYRLPKGIFSKERFSFCPHCKQRIRWFDNIPLLSYIFLRGRCRHCRQRISFVYPLVELIGGLCFLFLFVYLGLTPLFFIYSLLICALIVSTFTDFEERIVPNEISVGGLVVGLLISFIYPLLQGVSSHWTGLFNSFLGALVGGASLYLTGIFGNIVFRKESMGGGDIKLLAMVGAFLGWKMVLLVFFISPFFGAVVGIALKLKEKAETIPYAPFLSLGSLISLVWGKGILIWLGF
ncbi:MAG: prepilin peptidase [Candidatus Omnitrophica bacterium]|nr:prepilin peptidase [Candidatus Omnitrophota bacterium]